ncbi:MAG: HigA family addiction module antidote protein [Magnetococcales bacterium]|nr:HigA family addiction module antidote protein [Magnetococcales bacterium]
MSKLPTTTEAVPGPLNLPPIPPGEILAGEMAELGLSASALARHLDLTMQCIAAICHGRRGIDADTALRLGRFFGTSPRFWLNLQASHDLAVAERDKGAEIARKVSPRAA